MSQRAVARLLAGGVGVLALVSVCASTPVVASPSTPDAAVTGSAKPARLSKGANACPAGSTSEIRKAPGKGRTVALTFDDGPGPWTARILDVLRAAEVPATFFDTGAHDAEYPDLARRTAADGHVLGVHSWDHVYPSATPGGWTGKYLRDQFGRTARLQKKLTGHQSCLVRTPGGFQNRAVAPSAAAVGLNVAGWTVDTRDWRQSGHASDAAVRRIERAAEAGLQWRHPVILLHAGKASHESESRLSSYRGNTVAALPGIIRFYRRHGYRFVVMSADTGRAR